MEIWRGRERGGKRKKKKNKKGRKKEKQPADNLNKRIFLAQALKIKQCPRDCGKYKLSIRYQAQTDQPPIRFVLKCFIGAAMCGCLCHFKVTLLYFYFFIFSSGECNFDQPF